MTNIEVQTKRPLSPHIQIYRWTITMFMSIMHRITGGALYVGTAFVVLWLLAVASGAHNLEVFNRFCASLIGQIILFLYSLALVHHMVGGLRHLLWDSHSFLLEKRKASRFAWSTLFISALITFIIWFIRYKMTGA